MAHVLYEVTLCPLAGQCSRQTCGIAIRFRQPFLVCIDSPFLSALLAIAFSDMPDIGFYIELAFTEDIAFLMSPIMQAKQPQNVCVGVGIASIQKIAVVQRESDPVSMPRRIGPLDNFFPQYMRKWLCR